MADGRELNLKPNVLAEAIAGAKGGSSSSHTPVEAPDSLNSNASAHILDLISEGEIVGFYSANPLEDCFLDETPIANSDGSLNFTDIFMDWRSGTQAQSYMKGFPSVENEIAVGVELKEAAPWVHAVSNTQLSAVRVRLSVASLSQTDISTGDTKGYTVAYAIDLQVDGGAFTTVLNNAFSGKTSSKYERSHRIDLPPAVTGWNVRVRRLTADTEDSYIQDTTAVESIVEVMDVKMRYPLSAYVGIKINATQFRSIPVRAYRMLGRIISIPSNYDPILRTYTGVWDGTFTPGWTNNPAWIWYDLVINSRYGTGAYVDASMVDKWALYEIAQYCDGLVPSGKPARATISTSGVNLSISSSTQKVQRSSGSFVTDGYQVGDTIKLTGFGGQDGLTVVTSVAALTMGIRRPIAYTTVSSAAGRTIDLVGPSETRFSCSVYLQRQEEAYSVIEQLGSMFRGISYWGTGAIIPVGDMPRDPVYTYTNANVIDGKFSYQGSSRRARHSVALVSWNDPEDFGRQKVEYVPLQEAIARYGIRKTDITAVGCMSRGQAQRVGRWTLLTEMYETDTVSFRVGLEGTLTLPGQIIRVADRRRAGKRIAGRIRSATTSAIVIDAVPAGVVPGNTLTVVIPSTGETDTKPISSIVGNAINVSPAFSAAPVPHSVWAIESESLVAQQYKVISISEGENMSAVITALQHEPGKFDAVDNDTRIDTLPTTGLIPNIQVPPGTVTISAVGTAGQVIAHLAITAKWGRAAGATSYKVEWRRDGGEWSPPQTVQGNQAELYNTFPGKYVCKVTAVNGLGISSVPKISSTFIVQDQTKKPGFVEALEDDISDALTTAQNAQATADGAVVSFWQASPPVIGSGSGQAKVGDIWFDTDDGNKVYRVVAGAWVLAADDDLAAALAAASTAQATADGKVKTYFANTAPGGTKALGDLWFDTNDKKLYRWDGSAWSQNVGDTTLDQLAGDGHNILWSEYSYFPGAITASDFTGAFGATAPTYDSSTRAVGNGGCLKCVTATTSTNEMMMFGVTGTDYNIPLTPGNYIVSGYVNSPTAGHKVRAAVRENNTGAYLSGSDYTIVNANAWERFSAAVTVPAGSTSVEMVVYINRSGVSGRTVRLDGLMIEKQVGTQTLPSGWVIGKAARISANAIAVAAAAQDTADGKIETYIQATMPTGASLGDLWFDSDDGNKMYRHNGTTFVVAQDTAIGDAIIAAAGAQATADGKVTTYYSTSAPAGTKAVGDLWYNADDMTLSRWNGSSWIGTNNPPTNGGENLLPNPQFTINTVKTPSNSALSEGDYYCDGWTVYSIDDDGLPNISTRWMNTTAIRMNMGNLTAAPVPNAALLQIIAQTTNFIPVVAGRTYKGEFTTSGNSFNVSNITNVDIRVRMNVRWYDATGTQIAGGTGYVEVTKTAARSSATASDQVVAPAGAALAKVELSLYCKNNTGAAWTPNNSVICTADFIRASFTKVSLMDSDIQDDVNYGRTSNLDLYSSGGFNRVGLRIPGSGHRVGDQRNLNRSLTSAYGMSRTTTALTATSTGAVSVNAHTVRYGSFSVSYTAVSNAVTGLTQGTTYVIYCSDPSLTGGVKTYFAGTNPVTVMNISDDIYVVGEVTIPTSGSSSGGGGGGGGGNWCVDADSFMVNGMRAVSVYHGMLLECYDHNSDEPGLVYYQVQRNLAARADCLRLVSESGASIIASKSTPMTLRDGSTVLLPEMLGQDVLVYRKGYTPKWEKVVQLDEAGIRGVARISVHEQCYFAGESGDAFIATHNNLKP